MVYCSRNRCKVFSPLFQNLFGSNRPPSNDGFIARDDLPI